MRTRVTAALAVTLIALAGGCAAAPQEGAPSMTGPAWVTVIGDVGAGNRPAFEAFDDAFFKTQHVSFDQAVAFDRDALLALPQTTVTAHIAGWPGPVRARGPRLGDVLAAARVSDDKTVSVFALDGYRAALTPQERAARDWVLAVDVDGAPLGVGGRGPAWLLYATPDGPADTAAESLWVWSVYLIAAGDEPVF